jgi:hypothetical protein
MLAGCDAAVSREAAGASDGAMRAVDEVTRQQIVAELLALGRADQRGRDSVGVWVSRADSLRLLGLRSEDSTRSLALMRIVDRIGWPARSVVGTEASAAAWLVLQHSPFDELQQRLLPVLEEAARRGDVARDELALLTDRIRVRRGEAQLYGTQLGVVNGSLVFDPIEDLPGLAERRRAMGLMPIDAYAKSIGEKMGMPVVLPALPRSP